MRRLRGLGVLAGATVCASLAMAAQEQTRGLLAIVIQHG